MLFTNERFWNISADAKMLYGILLDRMSLSAKNGWIDKNGRVYIIFTIDEAKMALNCAEQKAIKLLSELEKKAGLIERKRQGLGKPNLIYVKNFISAVDSQLLNCENHNSGTMEITTQELPKSQCNNTDINNTDINSHWCRGASGRNCPQSVYETECRTHSICYGLLQGEHHKD